ncbi:MAG: hypothetical protein AB7U63_20165 [Porticoccaceae bacterium]
MRYRIEHPKLAPLNMENGDHVMALDEALRKAIPTMKGWSYSFADDTLTVDAPAWSKQVLSFWGEVKVDG